MLRDGRKVSLHVDPERYAHSVHGAMDCVICHADLDGVEEYPHERGLARVDCTECHDDDDGPVPAYRESTHGQLADEGDPLAPLCQDCHGEPLHPARCSEPELGDLALQHPRDVRPVPRRGRRGRADPRHPAGADVRALPARASTATGCTSRA